TELKYSNGTAILIDDRVALANGELGTVVELYADVESLFSSSKPISPLGTPGVLVVTDKGARVVLSNLQPDDLYRVSS
ncbi:MAG: hypothetical protein WCC57_15760, partial [Paracoccaceae bacterium]